MVKIERRFNLILLIANLFLFFFFAQPQGIFAATFSLSVRPYEGGYNLNYGKISPVSVRADKEVTVDITSDLGKQYRLVQTILDPLSTPEGSEITSGNFFVYGVRGSNKSGTLNVEQEVPVGLSRQVIYTSNQTGESDSFTLVYGLIISQDAAPGSYRGRIGFTLEPIDSTQSPETAILNIFAEVEVESAIEIKTVAGAKNIKLKPGEENTDSSSVIVNIQGGFGKQFQILQSITEQPVSSEGNFLDWEAVKFVGTNAQKGMVINEPTALSLRNQIIYTSLPGGEADSFVISYSLGDLTKEKAGSYKSKIKYLFEGLGFAQERLIETLDLEIDNPRVFDLSVSPQMAGVIRFRDLMPQQPPKTQEVILEVKTNIAKQYQLTQKVTSLLTSKEGNTIPQENFTLRQEGLETKGTLKCPDKTEVKTGEMVLFISDKEGLADKFKVIYELTIPRDIHPGEYSTGFTYSVSEI